MEILKKRKLKLFGHEMRREILLRAVMGGSMEGRRGRGRPQENCFNNLKEWIGRSGEELKEMAKDREALRAAVFDFYPNSLNNEKILMTSSQTALTMKISL